MTKQTDLPVVVNQTGVDPKDAKAIVKTFMNYVEQIKPLLQQAKEVKVTDESDAAGMEVAKQVRLQLKNLRVAADKDRKALKANALAYGNAVQGAYNYIHEAVKPAEEYLTEQEKFKEVQEQKRREALHDERVKQAEGLEEYIPQNLDYGGMSAEDWQSILNGAKLQKNQADEAAEAERKEAEFIDSLGEVQSERMHELLNTGLLEYVKGEPFYNKFGNEQGSLGRYTEGEYEEVKKRARLRKKETDLRNARFNEIAPYKDYVDYDYNTLHVLTEEQFDDLLTEGQQAKAAEMEQFKRVKKQAEEMHEKAAAAAQAKVIDGLFDGDLSKPLPIEEIKLYGKPLKDCSTDELQRGVHYLVNELRKWKSD